jgi:hypothetical protein
MKTKINPIDCYAALKTKSSFVTNHCNHLLSNKENIYHHVIGVKKKIFCVNYKKISFLILLCKDNSI